MRLLPTGPWYWLAWAPTTMSPFIQKEGGRDKKGTASSITDRWCSHPFCFYPIGQNLVRGPVFIYSSLCPGKTQGFSIKKGGNGYWCATNTFSPRAWWRPHNSSANICWPDGSLCYSWWLIKRANVLFPNTSSKAYPTLILYPNTLFICLLLNYQSFPQKIESRRTEALPFWCCFEFPDPEYFLNEYTSQVQTLW